MHLALDNLSGGPFRPAAPPRPTARREARPPLRQWTYADPSRDRVDPKIAEYGRPRQGSSHERSTGVHHRTIGIVRHPSATCWWGSQYPRNLHCLTRFPAIPRSGLGGHRGRSNSRRRALAGAPSAA